MARVVISNFTGRWFLTPLHDDSSAGDPHTFDDLGSAVAYAGAHYPEVPVSQSKEKKRTHYVKSPRVWLHIPSD